MNPYLKISEYLAEGEDEKASVLFRDLVITEARKIYDDMDDELETVDVIGGDASDALIHDVETDERTTSMEGSEDTKPKSKKSKDEDKKSTKSGREKNTAHLVPAPKPINKQPKGINNLTPFPKTN